MRPRRLASLVPSSSVGVASPSMAMGTTSVPWLSVVAGAGTVAGGWPAVATEFAMVTMGITGACDVTGMLMGGWRGRPRAVPGRPKCGGRRPSALGPNRVWELLGGTMSMWLGGGGTPIGSCI